jgi:hypothetical protein
MTKRSDRLWRSRTIRIVVCSMCGRRARPDRGTIYWSSLSGWRCYSHDRSEQTSEG